MGRRGIPCLVLLVLGLMGADAVAQTKYQTIGPASCGIGQNNCHVQENSWYKNDPHKVTVDKLSDDVERAEKYAEFTGVGSANMYKGTSTCMQCHGTVISGKENSDVDEGASCESCHGPGSGYKDPHQEGKGGGRNRPGYIKGLQTGMADLKALDIRAKTCVRCHYITDQKLLAAGHSPGARFNDVSGIKKVAKHWKRESTAEDTDRAPFDAAMKARGPVSVPLPPPPTARRNQTETPVAQSRDATRPIVKQETPIQQLNASDTLIVSELPPFPQITEATSIDSTLLLIKQRLELLYRSIRKK